MQKQLFLTSCFARRAWRGNSGTLETEHGISSDARNDGFAGMNKGSPLPPGVPASGNLFPFVAGVAWRALAPSQT
jgi:hypothetical protein